MGGFIVLFGTWFLIGGIISVLDNVEKWNRQEKNYSKQNYKKKRLVIWILFILWIIAGALLIIKTIVGGL